MVWTAVGFNHCCHDFLDVPLRRSRSRHSESRNIESGGYLCYAGTYKLIQQLFLTVISANSRPRKGADKDQNAKISFADIIFHFFSFLGSGGGGF